MYLTMLWTEISSGHTHEKNPAQREFDIKEHEQLQDAVIYLVKNGAKFDNQEIVEKVNWMPKDSNLSSTNKGHSGPSESPQSIDPGPPPGTVSAPAEQPVVISSTHNNSQSTSPRSMFDNIIPAGMRRGL